MGVVLLIVLAVVVATVGLAFLGQRIGAQMEEPHLGAGTTEQHMRTALSPSVLGALLGMIPFIVFTVVLVYQSVQIGQQIAREEAAAAAEAARD